MFALFVGGGEGGLPVLLTAEVVAAGGGSHVFDLNWTKTGNMSGYSIYLEEVQTGGSVYNRVYGPISPSLLTFTGNVSTFPDFNPGDNPNNFDFKVFLEATGPTQAGNSPISLIPPY